jgi:LacI family transcriptional regulator
MRVVTIRDIARSAGVSVSTVSRVLNSRPDVRAGTRERVLEVVRQCDYTQNSNARNLKQRSIDFVAVIVRGRMNIFLTGIAENILECGRGAPYQFILEFIDEQADEFEAARRLYAERYLSGIIFLGSNTVGHEADIKRLSVPCVFATIEGAPLTGVSSVSVDNRAASRRLADMLFSLGHGRIAYVGEKSVEMDSIGKRYAGLMDAYAARGLAFDEGLFTHSNFSLNSAYAATQGLLARTRNFTALIAVCDIVAMGAIKALWDAGLRVPGDVSVAGFDGLDIAQYSLPPLTTIRQPAVAIARKSVELMVEAIQGSGPAHIIVEAELLRGGTVRRTGAPIPVVAAGQEAPA